MGGRGGSSPAEPERPGVGRDRWLWAEEQLEQRPWGPIWELGWAQGPWREQQESWGGTWSDPWDRDRGAGAACQGEGETQPDLPSQHGLGPPQAWPQEDRCPISEGP